MCSPDVSEQQEEKQPQQVEKKRLSPVTRRILIVDDDSDIIFTFKKAFEEANRIGVGNKFSFYAHTYNDPLVAISEFKSHYYDIILIDINMPKMNGFDFCMKLLELDANPRVCFMFSGLINQEAFK